MTIDTTVTSASLNRTSDGTVSRVNTFHEAGEYDYEVSASRWRLLTVTPITYGGSPIFTTQTKSLFKKPQSSVKDVYVPHVMKLLASARQHVNEHYEFEIGNALWFHNFEGEN